MILLKMVKAKGKWAANTAPTMVRKDMVLETTGKGNNLTVDEEEELTLHDRGSHTNHNYTKRFQAKRKEK
jgi:hypothetical protein